MFGASGKIIFEQLPAYDNLVKEYEASNAVQNLFESGPCINENNMFEQLVKKTNNILQ